MGANRNQRAAIEQIHLRLPHTRNPQTGGPKLPFQISANRLKITQISMGHILGHISCCEVMPSTTVWISPKPQMSELISSIICAVVERPDHCCGDDLVSVEVE